ncbi:MAG: TIGR02281 family clan AA aspartic protease [Caldimonas sp.]
MRNWLLAALLICAAASPARSQSVSMAGSLGRNALLVIDGKPHNVAVGATVAGVKLVSVSGNDALVEVAGKRVALQLGGAQVNLGGKQSEGSGKQIVLTADAAGHFFTAGTINGKAVRFVVDTGATTVSMSQEEADRIGLDYKSGPRGMSRTANGVVPVYRTQLASLRIGDVQVYNVDASVLPGQMSQILLGNTFLTRFQMKRENDVMTLDMRF